MEASRSPTSSYDHVSYVVVQTCNTHMLTIRGICTSRVTLPEALGGVRSTTTLRTNTTPPTSSVTVYKPSAVSTHQLLLSSNLSVSELAFCTVSPACVTVVA